ncbi:MAG: flagellar basal body P-ring protein FlgI [Planctomycetaceae bacterium]|jgi:flagellar P-ring protein precursor FlgI|nr:flagellar basal body P-ring protein FlgI [Planctomycetaceae bacterium]
MSTKCLLFQLICFFALLANVELFGATLRVENVARVKGQEGTVIQGFGIVSGLNGSGDDLKNFSPAAKSILQVLTRSGLPENDVKSINSSRNSALVVVSATIPANGARSGDLIDCSVASVGNAKSLAGGRLTQMKLFAPIPLSPEETPIQGIAWGNLTEIQTKPNNAFITNGCRLTADFNNPYIKDGCVTLVLRPEHANMRMAFNIASSINNEFRQQTGDIAKAIDGSYVIIRVPKENYVNPMKFMDQLLATEIFINIPMQPQVLIDEKSGTIIIDEDVHVKPVVISHKNIEAEIRPPVVPPEQEINPRRFIDVDTETKLKQFNGENITNTKLKALQASMDSLRLTPQEMIDVIKALQQKGAIIGEVKYVGSK